MDRGVIITKGPQAWEIIQQQEGEASIDLKGYYILEENSSQGSVYGRVVLEDTGESICGWQKATHQVDNGWELCFQSVPVGGLYRIETCMKIEPDQPIEWAIRGDMIQHIGVGDVYVIAGQSNSSGYGKGPVFDPPEMGIHLLKNNGRWDVASHPFNESTGTIHPVNREGANPGHSPYLSFAKRLKKDLGYPIGLIQTALGGSPLSAWNPEEEGILYHNMIQIIKESSKKVKGILWYQGCSETDIEVQNLTYKQRFETMLKGIRKDLDDEQLPILTVQLNKVTDEVRYEKEQLALSNTGWSRVREAQRKAALEIEGVYVVPSSDSTLCDMIHNSAQANLIIGERLARVALKYIYGKQVICDAPDIIEAIALGEKQVQIKFNHVHERLYMFEAPPEETAFEITDENGVLKITSYTITGENILFELERSIQGKASISCGVGRMAKGYIPMDVEGHLPALLFHQVPIKQSI